MYVLIDGCQLDTSVIYDNAHANDVFRHLGELPPSRKQLWVVLCVLSSTDVIVLVGNRSHTTEDDGHNYRKILVVDIHGVVSYSVSLQLRKLDVQ